MLSKKCMPYGVVALLLCVGVLSGCVSTPHHTAAKLKPGQELAAWKGEWLSISAISGASALNDDYKAVAAGLQNYTVDGFKAAVDSMYATPVVRAKFDGSNTVVLTVADADGNEKDIACEYRYKGEVPMPGHKGHFWHTFEAVKAVRGLTNARYLIATLPHQDDPKGMLHWHARFGSRDVESLVNADAMWWPTYVNGEIPTDELVQSFKKSIVSAGNMVPPEPFLPYKGKWINTALLYDDPRPAVQQVYADLIKEFAGKKDGADFTKADIIALAKKAYGTAADFTHFEFIAEGGKNELIVWKNNTEVARLAYKRDGANKLRPTSRAFMAGDREKAGKFAFMSLTTPHGKPAHMHAWHAAKPSDIDKVEGKPTCIPANSSEEEVAYRVRVTCRRFLQEAAK